MTELEWRNCADPEVMLNWLRGKASIRKLRLFGCACCRRIWPCLIHPWSRTAVETVERHADGLATNEELSQVWGNAQLAWRHALNPDRFDDFEINPFCKLGLITCDFLYLSAAEAAPCLVEHSMIDSDRPEQVWHSLGLVVIAARKGAHNGESPEECREQAILLRDLFGPLPFRSVSVCKDWLTPAIVSLATEIYEQHSFDRLTLLADALELAGCSNQEMLKHLRSEGPHVRGCWLLDLILGKS